MRIPVFRCPQCHDAVERWRIFAVTDYEEKEYVACRRCRAGLRVSRIAAFFGWMPLVCSALVGVWVLLDIERRAPIFVPLFFLGQFVAELVAPWFLRLRVTSSMHGWTPKTPKPTSARAFLLWRSAVAVTIFLAATQFPESSWIDPFSPLRTLLWIAVLILWIYGEVARARLFAEWDARACSETTRH